MTDNVQTVIGVLILGLIALVAIAIFSPLFGVALDLGIGADTATVEQPETDETYELDGSISERPDGLTVRATTEYALLLDGQEGTHAAADVPDGWNSGSWTVAIVGGLGDGVEEDNGGLFSFLSDGEDDSIEIDENAAYTLVGFDYGEIELAYDTGEWIAYYNDGDGNDAVVSVPATEPEELTAVVAGYDENTNELFIDVDGTRDTATLDDGPAPRNVTWEWPGRIDELRLFDGVVGDPAIAAYQADPIDPLSGEPIAARWMFDEGTGETADAFYADTRASLEGGATWTDAGVEDPGLVEGDDYALSFGPMTLTVLSGGYLVDAPIVHVEWGGALRDSVSSLISGIGSSLQLIPIIMVVALASVVIVYVTRIQNA